jgi:exopolyphosphatase/guanosine-5'-triphosphate,3'-diphosphate pyrophosphatase
VKVAALDLGSNTFLCLIAEVSLENGSARIDAILRDEVRIVRLGEGLVKQDPKHRHFSEAALVRAKACLQEFRALIDIEKPDRILAMATAAARDVKNSQALLDLGRELGIPIEIIPGEKEAEISFRGALPSPAVGRVGVLDIGGGSTEFILGQGAQLVGGHSFNFGCVKLTETFLTPQPARAESISQLRAFVQGELKAYFKNQQSTWGQPGKNLRMVAVAGTPTELARISLGGVFDRNQIDGMRFDLADLKKWRQRFEPLTPKEIQDQWGVSPGRADLILSGVLILEIVCEELGLESLEVSTRGVRFGVALHLAEKKGA